MNLTGKNVTFHNNRNQTNATRALILLVLVVISIFFLQSINRKEIISPYQPTATPTRNPQSFILEADTRFISGDLDKAVETYQNAIKIDPTNAQLYYLMARIQTYSSATLTTNTEKATRLAQALDAANQAVKLAPEDSTAYAVLAFVLDWYSNPDISGDQSSTYIVQAEQAANQAIQKDNTNTLALAYFAEILNDEQKWTQATQYAKQALDKDPTLMDVHRVNALVQETLGNYGNAIDEYKKAADITPNLTFLYISIGGNYRILKQYQLALEYYARAASIDDSLGVKDPIPYIAIGKTYSQMGEFFIASINMRKAITYNPYSADVYGQLGIVYFRSRNYESAIPALKCAVKGCTAQETCDVRRCDKTKDPAITITGMPLKSNTVVYYYTYGSVLAGMHRPTSDTCTEAVQVLGQVRDGFGGDPIIMNIIKPSEDICASYGIQR